MDKACCCLLPKGCGDVRGSIPKSSSPKSSSSPWGCDLDQQPQIPMAIEPPRTEKTFKITKTYHEPVLLSPITQPHLPAPRSHTTNSSRDGDSTSLVSPSQCLTTLSTQKFSQYPIKASPGPLMNHHLLWPRAICYKQIAVMAIRSHQAAGLVGKTTII